MNKGKTIYYIILILGFWSNLNAQDIVGGSDVDEGKYPFMVGVLSSDQPNLYEAINCGASLIAPRWVLTAAHCVANLSEDDFHILIGTVDLTRPSRHHKRIRVKRIYINPNYSLITKKPKNSNVPVTIPYFDIALLELEEAVTARVVNLPQPNDDEYNLQGINCIAMGWGKDEIVKSNRKKSSVLQEAKVAIIERGICRTYEGYNEFLTKEVLCAGQTDPGKPVGGASGDSGGPLIVAENNELTIIGIMSWGYPHAEFEKPGVYQRVAPHLQWISNITGGITSIPRLSEDYFLMKTFEDHYDIEISNELGSFNWSHYAMNGHLLNTGSIFGPNKSIYLQRRPNIPTVIYISAQSGAWTRTLR